VILDVNNVANQSDVTNDRGWAAFTITSPTAQLSDLVVQSFTVNPSSGLAGSSTTASLTIRNQGAGTALASTTNIRISTSTGAPTTQDPLLVQLSIPAIAPGATYSVSPTITIPSGRAAGQNYIWVILDVNNVANQSDVTNDRGWAAFTITSPTAQLSDLVVQSFTVNPSSGLAGSSTTANLTIRNQGAGTALASTTNIRISTSSGAPTTQDPLLVQLSIPAIAPGATDSVSSPLTIPSGRAAGQNYIWVILDVNNVANQSNVTNDRAWAAFTIR
jgi:uncharacterized membrane protein